MRRQGEGRRREAGAKSECHVSVGLQKTSSMAVVEKLVKGQIRVDDLQRLWLAVRSESFDRIWALVQLFSPRFFSTSI